MKLIFVLAVSIILSACSTLGPVGASSRAYYGGHSPYSSSFGGRTAYAYGPYAAQYHQRFGLGFYGGTTFGHGYEPFYGSSFYDGGHRTYLGHGYQPFDGSSFSGGGHRTYLGHGIGHGRRH